MHMSMHNWMRSEPLDVTLARLARFGYESIEIKGEPEQYDTKTVRGQLDHYGVRCWGAVTLTLAERNLCASNEAQRAASVRYVKDCVTMVTVPPCSRRPNRISSVSGSRTSRWMTRPRGRAPKTGSSRRSPCSRRPTAPRSQLARSLNPAATRGPAVSRAAHQVQRADDGFVDG